MDIILLLIIAVFIIFRLFSIIGQDLGGNTEDFKKDSVFDVKPTPQSPNQSDDSVKGKVIEFDINIKTKTTPVISDTMRNKIAKVDSNFNPDEFIGGANSCFATIIESFANSDKDKLKSMLTADAFEVFSEVIDERIEKEEQSVDQVVAFIKTKIMSATVNKNVLNIKVKFTTDQINVVYDNLGRVTEGHPNDVVRVDDEWIFTRDMNSSEQNWYLKETQ